MDIPLDQFGGRHVTSPTEPDRAVGLTPLDWHGLVARLVAGHAARQILILPPRRGDSACGSFAPGIARDLAGWRATDGSESSPGVNLNTKADGKPPRPIGRNDAGVDRFIVRGPL